MDDKERRWKCKGGEKSGRSEVVFFSSLSLSPLPPSAVVVAVFVRTDRAEHEEGWVTVCK